MTDFSDNADGVTVWHTWTLWPWGSRKNKNKIQPTETTFLVKQSSFYVFFRNLNTQFPVVRTSQKQTWGDQGSRTGISFPQISTSQPHRPWKSFTSWLDAASQACNLLQQRNKKKHPRREAFNRRLLLLVASFSFISIRGSISFTLCGGLHVRGGLLGPRQERYRRVSEPHGTTFTILT